MYNWRGFDAIPQALEDLKNNALREKSGNAVVSSQESMKVSDDDEDEAPLDQSGDETMQSKPSASFDPNDAPSSCSLTAKAKTDNRREKSLGLLTQNFVKLFLTTDVDIITLDQAAKLLLNDIHGPALMRNNSAAKVRRLYDIANVLSSLRLIEKTHDTESRKPAFRWLGYRGKPVQDASYASMSPNPHQSKKREFGTDMTNMNSIKRSKLDSLIDDKPIKVRSRQGEEPSAQRDCGQVQQKQSSNGYVFGPFRPVGLQRTERKDAKSIDDWEALASSYRPQYHNQALSDLFTHYMEAWKSWYVEMAQGNNLARKAIHQPS